jgi:hypothetical protein
VGRRGDGYGSEYHLHRYLEDCPDKFNESVAEAVGCSPTAISWLPSPHTKDGREREFRGLEFLPPETPQHVRDAWRDFWPSRGSPPTWDAIGRTGSEWILVEAKSNHPEFCSGSCKAVGDGFRKIERSLNQVKGALNVHRFFTWTGSYYQHANRLGALWFLRKHEIGTRLLLVYFIGDRFPDGTPCPASEEEWEALIEARRLTLGLPERHALTNFEHHVFLPACIAK